MRLSVQEHNFVSIYQCGTRTATVSQLREAVPYMDAHDAQMVHALIGKLEHLSDSGFTALLSPEEVCV